MTNYKIEINQTQEIKDARKGFISLLEEGIVDHIDSLKFDPSTLLIFQHLPKTGGESLSELLRANLKPWYIAQWFRMDDSWNECLSDIDEKGYRLIGGHVTYDHLRKFPWKERKANLIAYFRNPISRIISHYFYQLTPKNPPYEAFKKKYPTLEVYVDSLPNNYLTRHWLLGEEASNFEEAINLLNERYSFIGVTELSHFSTLLLTKYLDIEFTQLENKNKNQYQNYGQMFKKVTADKQVMDMIVSKNSLDIQIYNYIINLYQSNIDYFVKKYCNH